MKKNTTVETPLSKFLVSAREKAGLTQKYTSDKLGYTTAQFVSNWERGVSQPPIKTLKKLAELYKVSADELFDVVLKTTISETATDIKRKFYGKASKLTA